MPPVPGSKLRIMQPMTHTDWSSDWSYTLPISCQCHGGMTFICFNSTCKCYIEKTTPVLGKRVLQNVEPFIVKCNKLKKLPSWTPLCQVNDSPTLKSFSFLKVKQVQMNPVKNTAKVPLDTRKVQSRASCL